MPPRKSADGAVANLVRSGRKQPQRFRAGSSASTSFSFRNSDSSCQRAARGLTTISEFEFLFSVFGLLIGLTLVEIAVKFADAIDAHHRRPIGVLTPLLASFVLIDVAGYWLFAWSLRDLLHVRWRIVFIGLTVAMIYYFSASMIFPRGEREWKNLDEHYWARKRLVIGGVLLVESATMAWQLTRAVPAFDDYWFWFYQLPYFLPMAALLFTRSRRADIVLFTVLIGVQLFSDFDLGQSSRWGYEVGISLTEQASTSASPTPK
jgi:hypothetical protein